MGLRDDLVPHFHLAEEELVDAEGLNDRPKFLEPYVVQIVLPVLKHGFYCG
jgi:hypothetical protein